MRDTILNMLVGLIAVAIVLGVIFGLVSIGKRWHAAEACKEDEAWVAVDYRTPGAFVDSHGVTRMCVNIDEIDL